MVISAEPLIYGLIFISVIVLVEGIYLTVFGKSISLNSRVNRRLEMLEKGQGRELVLEQLRKEMTQHMKSRSIPLYAILANKAQKANIAFTPSQLIMLMGVLGVVAYFGLTFGTAAGLAVRIAVSVVMGVGGIYVWVNRKAKKRMGMIEEQLPDAVELMVRSLRVGHPFTSAINIVAKEVPDPFGTEMGVIADEAAYGRDLSEALKAMAEILDGLAKVIRSRFKLFRRVKAITAEAKWSGMFLSMFPLLALLGISILQPDYYDDVKKTAYFIPACLVVAAFLTANIFVMRHLVNIKV
jgi:tight adherence protein B